MSTYNAPDNNALLKKALCNELCECIVHMESNLEALRTLYRSSRMTRTPNFWKDVDLLRGEVKELERRIADVS